MKYNYVLLAVCVLIGITATYSGELAETCFLYGGFLPILWLVFKAMKEWEV